MKVTIFTDAPAPYRIDLFKYAQRYLGSVDVLFQRPAQALRNWELLPELPYRYQYPPRFRLPLPKRDIYVHPTLHRLLLERRPDAVVAYGFSPAVWQCATYCKKADIPLILANDGTAYTDPVRGVEAWLRRTLMRTASGFIAACGLAAEYFIALGANPHSVHVSQLSTDLRRIHDQVRVRREAGASMSLRVDGRPTVCFVGRLIPQKRVLNLCEAVVSAAAQVDGLQLIIAGDGPDRRKIASLAAVNEGAIRMLGMQSADGVLDVYAASDLLLFTPVMERYGMVVIEALAAGVPVITTRECGAGRDLIREDSNGWFVPEDDVPALTVRLVKALRGADRLERGFAEAVIREHDVRVQALRFAEAVAASTGSVAKGESTWKGERELELVELHE